MIYAIYISLVVIAFLIMLNGFLRGAMKTQIDAVLVLLCFGLVVAAFAVAGLMVCLLSIAILFLSAAITRPIAARVASMILGMATGGRGEFVGLPPESLQSISQNLGQPIDLNHPGGGALNVNGGGVDPLNALLDYCKSQPEIQNIMKEFQVSHEDLKELYYELIKVGAGQWTCGHYVAASALAYPKSLRYLLARKGYDISEIAFNIIMYFEKGSALEV